MPLDPVSAYRSLDSGVLDPFLPPSPTFLPANLGSYFNTPYASSGPFPLYIRRGAEGRHHLYNTPQRHRPMHPTAFVPLSAYGGKGIPPAQSTVRAFVQHTSQYSYMPTHVSFNVCAVRYPIAAGSW